MRTGVVLQGVDTPEVFMERAAMIEALGFDVPAGLAAPLPSQAQLDLLESAAPIDEIQPMSVDVEPGEKIH